MNTLRYWLPQSYDAFGSLPVASWDLVPEAKLLVSLLAWKHAHQQIDKHGFSYLHSQWLKTLLGRGYSRLVNDLARSKVIARKNYSAGRFSYGYRLANSLTRCPVINELVESTRIRNRLAKWQAARQAEQETRWQPIHHELAHIDSVSSRSIVRRRYGDYQRIADLPSRV